ncbi:thyroid hormone receptor interactor 10b isoform X1 [Simochromis diagramma]|uniref:thyroid hormone receptor interactor 10b isoform X1 n=1 Tax=Simochromis diagramma TaxID=43689 RepID=UPI001A7E34CE|nr:thyroid hormone receptor interactor 10b isoform X1 [Simochromis diagramma]
MDWGTQLWDQYDVIDKHTQSGLDLVDRYIKFVKERSEIEQNYAKQLRNLTKKYAKRGNREDQDCKFSNHASFQEILNELNDYAGQRELIAENLITGICVDLLKKLQDFKQERKMHLADVKKAQQNLESSFKHLENTKKRYAKEWAEAEKASQQAEKAECEVSATKVDVEKAKQHAHARTHTAEECRNDYAAELQKYNKEQNYHYYTDIPQLLNKLQGMDERRIRSLADGYCKFSDIEKKVLPIISKCLEGISAAGTKVNEKQDSILVIEQHKSGFEPPADVDFEDYSQGIKSATSESSLNPPKVRGLIWPFSKKHKIMQAQKQMQTPAEDYSHLPPEQRKKRLQTKIDDIHKDLQKAQDQSEALEKMKGVYEQNPQMGDPSSLEPRILEMTKDTGRLRGELAKYETWLSEALGGEESPFPVNNNTEYGTSMSSRVTHDPDANIYAEFDEEFDEIESPIGQCTALYSFEGNSEGTVSIKEGELLSIMEEDKGDGWMRVLRASGDEGYIPSSYVKLAS